MSDSTACTQQCGRCKQIKSFNDFSPSYRGKTGTWCRPCFAAYNRGDKSASQKHSARACEQCGIIYIPKILRTDAAYCSRECKDSARYAEIAAATLAKKALQVRSCLHCTKVLSASARKDAIFCSARCNYGAHALQRKLRMRTGEDNKAGYLRAAVCERDNWSCGLCQKPVNRELEHPDPMCPSLDHIIPVSRGGSNDPENLQLTHLVCNLRRRNMPIEYATFMAMLFSE